MLWPILAFLFFESQKVLLLNLRIVSGNSGSPPVLKNDVRKLLHGFYQFLIFKISIYITYKQFLDAIPVSKLVA